MRRRNKKKSGGRKKKRKMSPLSSNSRFATDSSLGNLSINTTFHTQREIKMMSALDPVFSLSSFYIYWRRSPGEEQWCWWIFIMILTKAGKLNKTA